MLKLQVVIWLSCKHFGLATGVFRAENRYRYKNDPSSSTRSHDPSHHMTPKRFCNSLTIIDNQWAKSLMRTTARTMWPQIKLEFPLSYFVVHQSHSDHSWDIHIRWVPSFRCEAKGVGTGTLAIEIKPRTALIALFGWTFVAKNSDEDSASKSWKKSFVDCDQNGSSSLLWHLNLHHTQMLVTLQGRTHKRETYAFSRPSRLKIILTSLMWTFGGWTPLETEVAPPNQPWIR